MDSNNKEKRGIYNTTFNNKNATPINADLEAIENAAITYLTYYIKGWHNEKRDKGIGAKHIKIHLEEGSEGQIEIKELVEIGNSIREYLKIFKEPYPEYINKSRKVYEWENKDGVRFRIAVDKVREEGLVPPLSPSDEIIISFYSDRNLKERMIFKNPEVEKYYKELKQENNKNLENFNPNDSSALDELKAEAKDWDRADESQKQTISKIRKMK